MALKNDTIGFNRFWVLFLTLLLAYLGRIIFHLVNTMFEINSTYDDVYKKDLNTIDMNYRVSTAVQEMNQAEEVQLQDMMKENMNTAIEKTQQSLTDTMDDLNDMGENIDIMWTWSENEIEDEVKMEAEVEAEASWSIMVEEEPELEEVDIDDLRREKLNELKNKFKQSQ